MNLDPSAFGFDRASAMDTLRSMRHGGLGVPILLLAVLGMMTLPVPAILLDLLFTFNITLALVVLLVGVYSQRPLDFAVFPTILLVSTLMRLSLNVASTRVVLLDGHNGGDAAGKVIEAFGAVVIGGNYVVGLVVFLILVIINFVVVTKGAGRISEVSARFTLDAMPGKQMAIDADLNAGMIDQEEARQRREDVSREADFYGAMDGASKFVRGDAVAGILILAVNILGGLGIGMAQHDLPFAEAVEKYSLLTIGDGLVAQIPSLLLSTAAALMVTRANDLQDMSTAVVHQMFADPRALGVAAMLLFVMGVIPGMPNVMFISLALVAAVAAYVLYRMKMARSEESTLPAEHPSRMAAAMPGLNSGAPSGQGGSGSVVDGGDAPREISWDDIAPVDLVTLGLGYRLLSLVEKTQGGELLARIKGVRKKLSSELGFLMPTVHVRDKMDLLPNHYRISLMGVTACEGEVYTDKEMAINPGEVFGEVPGIETVDPAFGLKALWIDAEYREQAQTFGYTVVDPGTVIATHLNQTMGARAADLIGHEEVQQMVDRLAERCPKLVEELIPDVVTVGNLLKVLQRLLAERVPVRDMRTIAEALVAARGRDVQSLHTAARIALSRVIVHNLVDARPDIPVITLDPALEQILLTAVNQALQRGDVDGDTMILEPALGERLREPLMEAAARQEMTDGIVIVVVSGAIRSALAAFVRDIQPSITVLSYEEIPADKQVTFVATIGQR